MSYNPFPHLPVSSTVFGVFSRFLGFIFPPKHPLVIQGLLSRRQTYKHRLLHHDRRILQIILNGHIPEQHPDQSIDVLCDLTAHAELASHIISILDSCSPELLAELREWQQNAHIISCIDSAVAYFPEVQQTDPIWDAMLSTILSFPQSPEPEAEPALPQPDDRELVMRRRVFFDEPQIQDLIRSLDDKSRLAMEAAADKERSRLPIFPGHLRLWDMEKAVVKD